MPSPEVLLRPMRVEDVAAAERLTAAAYTWDDGDGGTGSGRTPAGVAAWVARTTHLLGTDPGGCWVADRDGEVLGVAVSFRRDLLWVLASYAVRPDLQGQGTGTALLQAALGHARGCLRGLLSSSDDPRAYRLYRRAGFSLHPTLLLQGRVDRSALPVVEHVREGTAADRDLLDSLDRRLREAAHGADHDVLAAQHRLLVTDRPGRSGYAYVDDDGSPVLLAASDRRTAARLTWEALASSPTDGVVRVAHVTQVNEWAVDVGLDAGLSVTTRGHLGTRGMRPPVPYLHHGSLL